MVLNGELRKQEFRTSVDDVAANICQTVTGGGAARRRQRRASCGKARHGVLRLFDQSKPTIHAEPLYHKKSKV